MSIEVCVFLDGNVYDLSVRSNYADKNNVLRKTKSRWPGVNQRIFRAAAEAAPAAVNAPQTNVKKYSFWTTERHFRRNLGHFKTDAIGIQL